MIKAIFFDFDGVITESVDIKTRAFGRLFEAEGPEIVARVIEYHVSHAGVSRFDKFKYFYKEFLKRALPDNEFQNLCEAFSRLVVEEVIQAPYVKGAKEFLDAHAGKEYRCYIASATPQKELEDIAERRGISGYFERIYGSPTRKGDAVRETLLRERLLPGETLYVGDALSDHEAARDNGVPFIARVAELDSIFADFACPRIADLTDLGRLARRLGSVT